MKYFVLNFLVFSFVVFFQDGVVLCYSGPDHIEIELQNNNDHEHDHCSSTNERSIHISHFHCFDSDIIQYSVNRNEQKVKYLPVIFQRLGFSVSSQVKQERYTFQLNEIGYSKNTIMRV